ncbi:AMP-binding protein [Nonomuraea gerenzanensis]|uniref:O-succinylbenzoic acid--CoA ligase n=1 Tax=Nonomuraea gerenzanensis TaxID=93944 RepID=A0A1M4EK41_9ACTN|nr:AMP-binding protein [Nonomuraea gerenzanensis]UBU10816.1 AMP-binding protein [Nonomuraea gerenzanensis]SBO99249.1 O-succinylbenzoic acid--CoA ligase [Nonomuraea gerenzanensis]
MDVSRLPGFYAIAAADPGRLAVIDTDDTRVTYGDLLARVNQVSHGLRARGLGTGDVVAGVLPNGVDALIMVMATGQIGLYYVPINWHLTESEIAYILGDCDAKVVVTEPGQAVPGAETGTAGLAEGQPTDAPADRTSGAVMWYTSGTTGFPKGVQRKLPGAEPEAIVALYMWFFGEVVDLRPGDGVHLVTSPMYHSAPCAHAQFALHLGHTVVITPRFDPVNILELIERHRVSNAMMVPTMFHRMLQLPADVRAKYDVSSLRQVIHTAAACPVSVKQQIMDWWGPVLYEYYGSTESTIAFSVKPHDWLARPGTVGRPAPTFEAKILDDAGEELPPGEPGMIYVKTSMGSFEYRKDPAKTAASKRGEWYAPGDIGYLDEDGYLFLCDRRTDLIVSGGVNIYPAEIEAALLEHPAVADVAVIGVPDEEWGHNVVALVQPAEGIEAGPELTAELMEHCGPRIARFKHPKVIEYREVLPRTPTGKLSRSKVRADYLAGNTSSSL